MIKKVVRWAALVFGITYGFMHHRSLAYAEAKNKAITNYKHKEELISKAKNAYSAEKSSKSSKEGNKKNFYFIFLLSIIIIITIVITRVYTYIYLKKKFFFPK